MEQTEVEHKRKMELLETSKKKTVVKQHIPSQQIMGPKVPPFEEGRDNMDWYIQRFERYAVAQKWNKEQWGFIEK